VEELGLGRTAMTAVVDRLERRGWVERKPHPKDRRVALLELTDSGRQVTAEMAETVRTISEGLLTKARPGARFDIVTEKLITKLR
jgi:DNA-binding MarR family transcriptional regulator